MPISQLIPDSLYEDAMYSESAWDELNRREAKLKEIAARKGRGLDVRYDPINPQSAYERQILNEERAKRGLPPIESPDQFGIQNFAGGEGGGGDAGGNPMGGNPNWPQNPNELTAMILQGRTPATPAHAAMNNIFESSFGYGDQLNQAFNSPTSPYAQLQASAAAIAPYRYQANADVDVARIKADSDRYRSDKLSEALEMAQGLFGGGGGGMGRGGMMGGIQAEGGGGFQMRPTNLAAFRPRRRFGMPMQRQQQMG